MINKRIFYQLIAGLLFTIPLLTACGGEQEAITTTGTQAIVSTVTSTITTTLPPTKITPTSLPTTTAGELAYYGSAVYNLSCGGSGFCGCHEEWNQGGVEEDLSGKEWFAGISWEYYGNAQKYYDGTKGLMPGGMPGTLSDLEYLQVVAFTLVELDKVQPEDLFGESNLATINLN
ncbi:hypothetical protein ACFLYB_04965 [Chloroflexota bacterium]